MTILVTQVVLKLSSFDCAEFGLFSSLFHRGELIYVWTYLIIRIAALRSHNILIFKFPQAHIAPFLVLKERMALELERIYLAKSLLALLSVLHLLADPSP